MPLSVPDVTERRRRRVALRSIIVASIAAFAGGVAVVAVQYGLGQVSAGYPPIVQTLLCAPQGGEPAFNLELTELAGGLLPVVQVAAGTPVECRLEAPGAGYATWSIVGPRSGVRSGPLDLSLPCQSPEDFAAQSTAGLRLSSCQRTRPLLPGLYMLSVAVMVRGHPFVDRTSLAVRVVPAEGATPESISPRAQIVVSLKLPARRTEAERRSELSASFNEHGLLPQSRNFVRTVYRLKDGEEFVSASFRARGAENASAIKMAYDPGSRSVTASFTLRSGPIVDRWQGWISGTAVVKVRRQEEAREIALPESVLEVPGQATLPLPEGVRTDGAVIRLSRPATKSFVDLEPGKSARLDRAIVSARVEDDALMLEATPE